MKVFIVTGSSQHVGRDDDTGVIGAFSDRQLAMEAIWEDWDNNESEHFDPDELDDVDRTTVPDGYKISEFPLNVNIGYGAPGHQFFLVRNFVEG